MLEIIINGQKVKGNAGEIAELLGLMETGASASATPKKRSQAAKAIEQPKTDKTHKVIEIQARYVKMADNAIGKAKDKHGITLVLDTSEKYNRGKDNDGKPVFHWAWLRCTDGKLNRDNGKEIAACMPKGWVYSPRRNAIRRDMGADIRKK